MIRKIALVAALCVMAALNFASTAGATAHAGSATGTNVGDCTTSGTDGVVGSVTVVTSLGNITCATGGFAGTLSSNNANSTASGSLARGTSGVNYGRCSSWFGITSYDQIG